MNLHFETMNQTTHGFFRNFGKRGVPTAEDHRAANKTRGSTKNAFDFPGFIVHEGDEDKDSESISYNSCSTTIEKSNRRTDFPPYSECKQKSKDGTFLAETLSTSGKYGDTEIINKPIDMRSQHNLEPGQVHKKQDHRRRWTKTIAKVPSDGTNSVQEPQYPAYSPNFIPAGSIEGTAQVRRENSMYRRRHTLGSESPATSSILSLAIDNDVDAMQEELEISCQNSYTHETTNDNLRCDDRIEVLDIFKNRVHRRHSGTSQSTHQEQDEQKELQDRASYFANSHVLINLERQKRNIPRLKRSVVLDNYARDAAREMAESSSRKIHSRYHGNIILGHNIRSMHERTMRRKKTKERANILNPDFTAFGIATCKGKDGLLYLCQLFDFGN